MGAGYFIYSIFLSSQGEDISIGGVEPIGGNNDEGEISATGFRAPTDKEKEEFPQGSKLIVGGVGGSIEVENFFQNAEGYWPERNEILIAGNNKYEFIFDREFGSFDVILRAEAKESDIPEIEVEVMNLLGVGKNELCKLNISYFLEYDVIEKINMGTLPLCSSVLE